MPTVIKMRLCEDDINKAIKEVDHYWKMLQSKTRVYCGKLTDLGYTIIKAQVGKSPLGNYVKVNLKYPFQRASRIKAVLFATGTTLNTDWGHVYPLMMIEFGAGIHYNPVDNPKASQFGMGVGTFPGQTHAFDTNGWYYMDDDGKWHHSYGVKATMPMYYADHEIIRNYVTIAKQVFKS